MSLACGFYFSDTDLSFETGASALISSETLPVVIWMDCSFKETIFCACHLVNPKGLLCVLLFLNILFMS